MTIAWPELMRAGMGKLNLRPAEFWALSPIELIIMLGLDGSPPVMTRDGLAALMAAYPDQGAETAQKGKEE